MVLGGDHFPLMMFHVPGFNLSADRTLLVLNSVVYGVVDMERFMVRFHIWLVCGSAFAPVCWLLGS